MSGYIIANLKAHDPQEYREYLARFMCKFRPCDGRILVATDDLEVLEGEWPAVWTVVMEFPSRHRAREWYQSEQYRKLAHHRFRAATTNMILVGRYAGRTGKW
jgi:uncharacterized protein (DUF1330 family)